MGHPGQQSELAGVYLRLTGDDGSYSSGGIYISDGVQGQN